MCVYTLSSLLPSRRRLPPATPSSSRCSWTRGSWWAASPRPCTPCSAPTCCPTSRREAGTWRKPPLSCWRQATGLRRAPCCWLTAEPTRPSSPSTLPWPCSGSGCEAKGCEGRVNASGKAVFGAQPRTRTMRQIQRWRVGRCWEKSGIRLDWDLKNLARGESRSDIEPYLWILFL